MGTQTNKDALIEYIERISEQADALNRDAETLASKAAGISQTAGIDPFIFGLTAFVLACFVGYFVVWKVTPALHTPLTAVTNAISGIIIVGAILAVGPQGFEFSHVVGFIAVVIASINIFGGFVVTQRMLSMFKKKDGGK